MAYFINDSSLTLEKLFISLNTRIFIENCIKLSKKLELGTFEKVTCDKNIFAIIQNTVLKDRSKCVYESHKKYIDIHIVVDGSECVDLIHISEVEPFESNIENDYYLYKSSSPSKRYELKKNMIGVFLFEDVHKAGIRPDTSINNVVKVVLKVDKEVFSEEFSYEC